MMNNKKRVLIIAANDMGNSGVPNVYMSIVRNLSDKYVFDILITRENYYFKDEFLKYGGKIYLLKEKKYKFFLLKLWWRMAGYRFTVKNYLRKLFKNIKYDTVHSFKESDSYLYLEYAKKYGIRNRILHINRVFEKGNRSIINLYENVCKNKSIKYSNIHIAVSEMAGKSFYKNINFITIYNCYNENVFTYRNDKDINSLRLLQIGTFLPLKNQIFSLKVYSKIRAVFPDSQMTFVGSKHDKCYYNNFVNTARKLNIEKHINIIGELPSTCELIQSSSFLLLPSFNEGLSLVAIESQACGVHCFASSNVSKEIDLGNITFLNLDEDLWANTIIDFYCNNGNKKQEVDMSKFSIRQFISAIDKIYNSI